MFTCGACGQPILDGRDMTVVIDAFVFNDGEVDHANTEHYYSDHVTITPKEGALGLGGFDERSADAGEPEHGGE